MGSYVWTSMVNGHHTTIKWAVTNTNKCRPHKDDKWETCKVMGWRHGQVTRGTWRAKGVRVLGLGKETGMRNLSAWWNNHFGLNKGDLHGLGYSRGTLPFCTGFWALEGIHLGHVSRVRESWEGPFWVQNWEGPLSLSSTRKQPWTKISPALCQFFGNQLAHWL